MKIDKLLICGQVLTSRTETLEHYFRDRIPDLAVIGITSPFYSNNLSRFSFYKNGRLIKEFKLPSFQVRVLRWYKQPLLFISFFMYIVGFFYTILRLNKRFDLFIGISCFSSFMGVILKKMRRIKKLIYYSIDYYPPPLSFNFNRFMVWAFRRIDRFCVNNADLVWHISPKIAEARYKYTGLSPDRYKHKVVSLTYSSKFLRFRPLEEVERYTIGFVGTLSENQGLQLLIKAMPRIIQQISQIKVRIIGSGPYEENLKKMVRDLNLERYFIFHGFIKDNNEVLELLSRCAIGVAIWTCKEDDNVLYADPGKPKLYAFCGLPIIITNGALIAKEIEEKKAGISINYNEEDLVKAISYLLQDEDRLKRYKQNSFDLARRYITEEVFDRVF